LDRAAALVKLRSAGVSPELFTEAAGKYSLGRLYGLLARLSQISPVDESDGFEWRYLVIQPSLDESVFKLWGQLPGVDGRIVEKALSQRETELPVIPDQGQGQRKADALTSICMDSLTGTAEGGPGRAVTVAEVFIDANLCASSFGEQGATVSTGPRVGPNTLSEILCIGQIRLIVTDGLRPLAYSDLGEAIPPAIRSYVLCEIKANVRSKDAAADTGSSHTTSGNDDMTATTTLKIWRVSAGITITSPSTRWA
jgi:hypothetical protein